MGSGPRRPRLAACAPARLMQRAVSGPAASRPCGPSVGYWQAQPRRLAREVLGAKLTDDDAFDLVRLVECQCYVVGRLLPPRGARRRRRQPFVTALGIQQVLCFVHFILPRTQSEWATAVAVSSVAWVCQGGGRVQQDGSCTCACTGARLVHGFTRSAAAAALLTSSLADTSEAGSKFPQPARKRHGAHDHDAARPTTTAGNGKMRATGQGTHGTGKSGTGTGSGMLGARIYALGQRRSPHGVVHSGGELSTDGCRPLPHPQSRGFPWTAWRWCAHTPRATHGACRSVPRPPPQVCHCNGPPVHCTDLMLPDYKIVSRIIR